MNMNVGEKVITGEWDGQPIFRRRTAEEVLLNELQKNDEARKLKVQHLPSDYPTDDEGDRTAADYADANPIQYE